MRICERCLNKELLDPETYKMFPDFFLTSLSSLYYKYDMNWKIQMGKQQNREKVAQEIKTVANLYKKHLVLQADMLSDPEGGAHYADH